MGEFFRPGALRNLEYSFIAIYPRSTMLTGIVVPVRIQSSSQKEVFNHFTVGKQITGVKLFALPNNT